MVTAQQLQNAGFRKIIDRPGMTFEVWKRRSDGRILIFKESTGQVFTVNQQGFGSEPIAMLLTFELADIIRDLGNATLGAVGQQMLQNRLMSALPLNLVSDPTVFGIQ
jgi:hypothetical protein